MFGEPAQLALVGIDGDLFAEGGGDRVMHRDVTPGLAEVDFAAPPVGDDPAAERVSGFQHELFCDFRHPVVVGIGRVELEHREFGIVRRVDALVAEIAADLVDPLDAADHEPLQIELERDPQEKIDIERIRVRGEWPRRRAAVKGLQDGGLDLDVAAAAQPRAQRREHGVAGEQHGARLRVDDQVDVPLPYPGLEIGQPLVLVRQRAQRLAREGPARGAHRELAAPGRDHFAGDADMVAEVDVGLPGGERVEPRRVGGEHHLQPLAALLQGREDELAGIAVQHHPAGDADDLAGLCVGSEVGKARPELGERRGARVAGGVRVDAGRPDAVELLAPNADLFRQVLELVGHRGEAIGGQST